MQKISVGIDVGGTWTKLGLVDEFGKCLIQTRFRTRSKGNFSEYLEAIYQTILDLQVEEGNDTTLIGIGVGAPDVNYIDGTIEHAPNLPWKGTLPFRDQLSELSSLPVKIINDANAAAWGELKFGKAQGMKDFMVITLGTGLGCGIVSNGELLQGQTGMAGELGHFRVYPDDGWLTGLGSVGGLEAYASATGLKRAIMFMLAKYPNNSRFRDIAFNDLHGHEINQAAEDGDIIAVEAFNYVGKILGQALANFLCFGEPEAIFLLGGLVNSGKWILEPTKKYFFENLLPIHQSKVDIHVSGLQETNAAIVGSSALVWD
jgi:glucokinase